MVRLKTSLEKCKVGSVQIDADAKHELFDAFAMVGKAVSSGRRVELLDLLANGERTVEGLSTQAGMSVANTSQHLQVLKRAGLVATRRVATTVRYRLASPAVFSFLDSLRTLAAERIGDVDRLAERYLAGRDELPGVSRAELAVAAPASHSIRGSSASGSAAGCAQRPGEEGTSR